MLKFTFALICTVWVGIFASPQTHAEDGYTQEQADADVREFIKEVARQRFTEVCSTPMPKGDALPQALNQAHVADPKTWGPWIEWWNETIAKYKKAGCGES